MENTHTHTLLGEFEKANPETCQEFLMGCLRLRGSATAMDVQKIINAPGLERVADGLSNSSGWAHCVYHTTTQ